MPIRVSHQAHPDRHFRLLRLLWCLPRVGAMPLDLDPAAFDAMVERALDGLPDELARLVDNVVVLVEAEAPDDDPDLLGLYDGLALTERPANHSGMLPDRILLFRGPLLDMAETEEELEDEVRITVVHEVAHHFGLDDARLHQLGWG
jgi:predicted Zn-dependent protease with MMP-like domain